MNQTKTIEHLSKEDIIERVENLLEHGFEDYKYSMYVDEETGMLKEEISIEATLTDA